MPTMQEVERELALSKGPIMDLVETAAVLRVSQRTVTRMRDEGYLESVFPRGSGRRITFRRAEVARYIVECGTM